MHNTAFKNATDFVITYCGDLSDKVILDIGSYDVNGSLKPIFLSAKQYIGLDQSNGPNVDLVASAHEIPISSNSIDIVMNSSCFEHDNMFWITFNEMCRVLKAGGFLYINAPSNGPYHAHPVDNWRFYADSWKALESWGILNGHNITLINSYIDKNKSLCGNWNDSVGIYRKNI